MTIFRASFEQRLTDQPLLFFAIYLLALLVRIWQLDYHSVWFDEAVSLYWAGTDPLFIWQKTFPLVEDKHPPLYYLGLHVWQTMLSWLGQGENDAALRLLGALLGVGTVWAITNLATAISGWRVGLLTGLLVALSPILVWYSQELRMFQPATTALALGIVSLWQAWHVTTMRRELIWWLGFVIAMTAALYTYLFSAFLLPTAGFALLLLFWRAEEPKSWLRFGRGLLALGATGILYLPLAYNAWVVNSNEGMPGTAFANLPETLWQLLRIFTIWRVPWPSSLVTITLLFFTVLLLVGLFYQSNSATDRSRSWLVLWIGLPLLTGNLLQAVSSTVFAEDRYWLFLTPFVLWAIARGVVTIGERFGWIGGVSGVSSCGLLLLALTNLWTPAMYREQWRAASAYITAYHAQNVELRNTIVAHVDYTRLPLEWYLRQHYTFDELPLYHPYGGTLTPTQIDNVIAPPLEGIVVTDTATLWLTQSHLTGVDEERLVEGWLNQRFPLVTELYPAGIKVTGYALQSRFETLPTLNDRAHRPATILVPGLELVACEVMTPVVAAQEEIMHPPSGWVHVRLWWRAIGEIDDDYIATAEVVGPEGAWGVRLYRENEALRRWPTSRWQPGDIVRDEVDINLNPVTPARTYPIIIGVMDSGGQSTGERVDCGTVVIQ